MAQAEPTRTCIVTRKRRRKRDLIRIVRTPDGDIRCDPTGRADGRGAYLSVDGGSMRMALARGILGNHLGVSIDRDQVEMLIQQIERERSVRLTGGAR